MQVKDVPIKGDAIQLKSSIYNYSQHDEWLKYSESSSHLWIVSLLPQPRVTKRGVAMANFCDMAIFITGFDTGYKYSSCERFDVQTQTWHKVPELV